jgi:uncharacterized protein (TIGR00369 family)
MIDTSIPLEKLNFASKNNLCEHLDIVFTEMNSAYLIARMPVDHRTHQQIGMLNGGASAALAETVGSMACYLSLNREEDICLGLEMKINHIKPVLSGFVYGIATAIHEGIQTHVWQIRIQDDAKELVAIATLTMAILPISRINNPLIRQFIAKFL